MCNQYVLVLITHRMSLTKIGVLKLEFSFLWAHVNFSYHKKKFHFSHDLMKNLFTGMNAT